MNAVAENSASGTIVGLTGFAADADATNNSITYSFDDDASGRFAIDGLTGVVTVIGGLDYELATSHVVTIRATSLDGSFQTQSFTISVSPQNDNAPNITSDGGGGTASVLAAENQTVVTTVVATNGDLPLPGLSFSIVSGADSGIFAIDGLTGQLRFSAPPNFEIPSDADSDGIYEVVVQASDAGLFDQQMIYVTVVNANEAPIAIADTGTAIEAGGVGNSSPGSNATGNVLVNDLDVDAGDSNSLSELLPGSVSVATGSVGANVAGAYGSIVIGATAISYTRSTTISLRFKPCATNMDTLSDVFTYTMQDGNGSTATTQVTITIRGANDAPVTIDLSNNRVDENAVGIVVGSLSTIDVDSGDSATFTLVNDASNKFEIVGNQLQLKAGQSLDFEMSGVRNLIVRITDASGATHDENLTIYVNDINKAPADIAPNSFSLDENTNTAAGYSVGVLTSTDPDGGETLSFAVVGGADSAKFSIGGSAGTELILTDGTIDFESQASFEVIVRVTDRGGLTHDETIIVNVSDLNEARSQSPH